METNPDAIIIGAGVAGLAAAIRLASQGFAVSVFDKNEYVGGKIFSISENGFQFDGGPSLLTLPHELEDLFSFAGEQLSDYLQYERVPISCTYFYESGKVVNAYADTAKFAKELEEQFGEQPDKVISYLNSSKELFENVGEVFLNKSLHSKKSIFHSSILSALRFASPGNLFSSLHTYNFKKFKNPETAQLFDRYATYNGSNPYKAPGMFRLVAHLEHNDGIYYPRGGMISIAQALRKLADKLGVQFRLGCEVNRIIYSDGKVRGVVADNINHLADAVISNVDVYNTYLHLLGDERNAKKIAKQERSSSALVFYWGMNGTVAGLNLHNIFFSKDYKAEFDHIFKQGKIFDDPTVYVNITSKMEAGMAPEEKENWFVMVNAPANSLQDWETIKVECRKNVIEKLSRLLKTDIESMIEFERFMDPVIIEEQTSAFKGALYGASGNSRRAAFMRHPNFTKEIEGLFFAGGTVHPGGGIPLCLKSAKLATSFALEMSKRKSRH